MTEGVESITAPSGAYGGPGELDPEKLDAAREKFLRARLHDDAHPLTNAQWMGIHRELREIKERHDARAYAATKHAAPSADASASSHAPPPALPGSAGLASLLAVRSGVLHAWHKPPALPADAPPAIVPIRNIGSPTELMDLLERETRFLASPLAARASPSVRETHREYLGELQSLARELARAYAMSPDGQHAMKATLYAELARLGDKSGCRAGDTVASLVERRDAMLSADQHRGHEQVRAAPHVGLDGIVFANEEKLARYEMRELANAMNPGTSAGAVFASIRAARGAGVEEMRTAGHQGEMVEGMGGGTGVALNANRATADGARTTPEGQRSIPTQMPHAGDTAIPKLDGRALVNARAHAFRSYPLPQALAAKYPAGVRFKANGFPDFSAYAVKTVQIAGLRGTKTDFAKADHAAGFPDTPDGYTWHHHEDGETMQLVPSDLHRRVNHTGGSAILRARARGDSEW